MAAEGQRPRHVLASPECWRCEMTGYYWGAEDGRRGGRGSRWALCGCVRRGAFGAVLARWQGCQIAGPGRPVLERRPQSALGYCMSIPAAEFTADVEVTARRVLTACQYGVFRLRYLVGGTWDVVLPEVNRWRARAGVARLEKADYFTYCTRSIEEVLGGYWMEAGIFPTRDYFARWMVSEEEADRWSGGTGTKVAWAGSARW
jgi:hypothetical protein